MTLLPFTPENVATIENRSGYYYFYNARRRRIYVGISAILRHRLQSYYQKDDLTVHRTKRRLRPRIKYFYVEYAPLHKARQIEDRHKHALPFNFRK